MVFQDAQSGFSYIDSVHRFARVGAGEAAGWRDREAEVLFVRQSFAAVILGGTGQVGGAAVAELLAASEYREVVMVTRKPIAPRSRVCNVVLLPSALPPIPAEF
jgi:hypothetical protein